MEVINSLEFCAAIPRGERNKRVMSYNSLCGLAMTRAFGDFNFPGVRMTVATTGPGGSSGHKPVSLQPLSTLQVICDPFISNTVVDQDDAMFLVVASDGLTEQWSVQGAAKFTWDLALAGHSPSAIAEALSQQ